MPQVLERQTTSEQTPRERPKPAVALAKETLIAPLATYDTIAFKGGTGSGKSVFGPAVFLEGVQRLHPDRRVRMIVTEPRQFLVNDVSASAANAHNTQLGGDYIGYYHGGGRKMSDATQIVYTVNKSLLNRLEEDITLPDFDAVFIDEIHLKEVDQFSLRIALQDAQKARKAAGMDPLKVIIASADVTEADAHFDENATFVEVPGRQRKEVKSEFMDRYIEQDQMPKAMARKFAEVLKNPAYAEYYGDMLGFLPGRAEIREAIAEFNRIMDYEGTPEYKAFELTGGGGPENAALLEKLTTGNPDGTRVPIIAFSTSVAEIGATFEWLKVVGDSGEIRDEVDDPRAGSVRMATRNMAVTSKIQREGRLGRTDYKGLYIGMYPESFLTDPTKMPQEARASIQEADTTPMVLTFKKIGKLDPYAVDYPEPPRKEQLDRALLNLAVLGAIKEDGTLTDEGSEMIQLPVDYHHARMIVEGKKYGCVEAMSVLSGLLGDKGGSLFTQGRDFKNRYGEYIVHGSDFLTTLNVWNAYVSQPEQKRDKWAKDNGFNVPMLETALKTRADLAKAGVLQGTDITAKPHVIDIEAQKEGIRKSIIAGFADKLLKWDEKDKYSLVAGHRDHVVITGQSTVGMPGHFVSANVRIDANTEKTYAGMNQVVSVKEYNQLMKNLQRAQAMVEEAANTPSAQAFARREQHRGQGEAAAEQILRERWESTESPEQAEHVQTPVADVYRSAFADDDNEASRTNSISRQVEIDAVRQEEQRRELERLHEEAHAPHQHDNQQVFPTHSGASVHQEAHVLPRQETTYNGPESFWRKARRGIGKAFRFWRWLNWKTRN